MMWMLLWSDPAWACKVLCESPFGRAGLVLPEDGATDVPVDAQPVVLARGPVRLVDPDGQTVASSLSEAVFTAPSASGFWAKRVASRNGESAAACASIASSHSSPRNAIRRSSAGRGSSTRSS